ncbi:unnamed protein product, partial [Closterium sp. Naga37s-1]
MSRRSNAKVQQSVVPQRATVLSFASTFSVNGCRESRFPSTSHSVLDTPSAGETAKLAKFATAATAAAEATAAAAAARLPPPRLSALSCGRSSVSAATDEAAFRRAGTVADDVRAERSSVARVDGDGGGDGHAGGRGDGDGSGVKSGGGKRSAGAKDGQAQLVFYVGIGRRSDGAVLVDHGKQRKVLGTLLSAVILELPCHVSRYSLVRTNGCLFCRGPSDPSLPFSSPPLFHSPPPPSPILLPPFSHSPPPPLPFSSPPLSHSPPPPSSILLPPPLCHSPPPPLPFFTPSQNLCTMTIPPRSPPALLTPGYGRTNLLFSPAPDGLGYGRTNLLFSPAPDGLGYGRTNLLFSPASDGLVPFAMTDCSLARPHAFSLLAHVRQAFLSCLLPHPSLDLPLPVFDWLPSLEYDQGSAQARVQEQPPGQDQSSGLEREGTHEPLQGEGRISGLDEASATDAAQEGSVEADFVSTQNSAQEGSAGTQELLHGEGRISGLDGASAPDAAQEGSAEAQEVLQDRDEISTFEMSQKSSEAAQEGSAETQEALQDEGRTSGVDGDASGSDAAQEGSAEAQEVMQDRAEISTFEMSQKSSEAAQDASGSDAAQEGSAEAQEVMQDQAEISTAGAPGTGVDVTS